MAGTFRHYRVLYGQLGQHVDGPTRDALLVGMDSIRDNSPPEAKARWAAEMMRRMDDMLDAATRSKVREGCACVLSNQSSVYARTFRRLRRQHTDDDVYLDQVVAYLDGTRPLRRCGEVTRVGDTVHSVIGRESCGCSVVREGLAQPISMTWCHCCKGSLLSVYRYVFPERACRMEIISTIATGGGSCLFTTTYR
jgi:hypothetical protein